MCRINPGLYDGIWRCCEPREPVPITVRATVQPIPITIPRPTMPPVDHMGQDRCSRDLVDPGLTIPDGEALGLGDGLATENVPGWPAGCVP
jgi:hypothetical protein